jgi:outer membrane protein TolC
MQLMAKCQNLPRILLLGFCWILIPHFGYAKTYSLSDLLSEARRNAPELREWRATYSKAKASSGAVEGAFDTTIFADTQFTHDKSQSPSTGAGDSRNMRQSTIGVRRMFGTGTKMEVAVEGARQETIYPENESTTPTVDPTNPGAGQVPAFDNSVFEQDPNPSYQSKLALTISQPLWRNFGAEEVDLQQKIANNRSVGPGYTFRIQEQGVQAETEQLYWALLKLEEQIKITKKLVAKSREFRRLMNDRTKIGRADQVDVASAESSLVSQEGQLLDLELASEETRKRLSYRINPYGSSEPLTIRGDLTKSPLGLAAPSRARAFSYGKENRLDLKMIQAQIPGVQAEKDLAREKDKPSLDLYSSLASNGLGEDQSGSQGEVGKFKHNTVTVGLKFEMSLGGSTGRAEMAASTAELQRLSAQRTTIERNFRREIDLAYTAHEASRKQSIQAEKNIKSLQRQLRAEQRKFKQARSEKIGAIRFEMEVLVAEMGRVEAHYKARLAESRVRHAIHSYQSER